MKGANTIQSRIIARLRQRGAGKVHTSKDFLDLGTRAAIDQALSRLAAQRMIRRLGRGLYHLPRFNRTLQIDLAPDVYEIAKTLARRTGSRIVPSGAVAANQLGLSTQVPAKPVYLTDGRTRTIHIGSTVVLLKHASPKDLPLAHPWSAMVFQALRYLGRSAVQEEAIARLRRKISPRDRKKLLKDSQYVTGWVADAVRKACGKTFSENPRHG